MLDDLIKSLEPLIAKEIRKLAKWAAPMIADAQAWDETSRQAAAKAIYKAACYVTAKAMHKASCPVDLKTKYRAFLCRLLKVTSF